MNGELITDLWLPIEALKLLEPFVHIRLQFVGSGRPRSDIIRVLVMAWYA
jgi:hypothetical protein